MPSCSPCGSSAPAGDATCTCATADVPAPSLPSDALYEKILHYQRLGYQLDVSMDALAEHAVGVPSWSSSSPTCGSCSTSAAAVCGSCSPSAAAVCGSCSPSAATVASGEGSPTVDSGEGTLPAVPTEEVTTAAPTLEELPLGPVDVLLLWMRYYGRVMLLAQHGLNPSNAWIPGGCCCANAIVTSWDWTTTDLDVTAATPFTDPGMNEVCGNNSVLHELFCMSPSQMLDSFDHVGRCLTHLRDHVGCCLTRLRDCLLMLIAI